MFTWARVILIGHALIVAVSLYFGWWMIPIVVTFAPFYGGCLQFLCNNTQHVGLQNAVVWGVLAGGLNLVPYIGSIVVTGASALVAFLQFGTLDMALAVGGASLLIHTLVGNLLTPWLTSRTSSMSPVAVFVSVLAWGWLWGLWGLLLGIPIMMAVKAICDRVEDLKAIGELLGH